MTCSVLRDIERTDDFRCDMVRSDIADYTWLNLTASEKDSEGWIAEKLDHHDLKPMPGACFHEEAVRLAARILAKHNRKPGAMCFSWMISNEADLLDYRMAIAIATIFSRCSGQQINSLCRTVPWD